MAPEQKRTVAFLDILGFKHAIETLPLHQISDSYERRIAEIDAMNQRNDAPPESKSMFPDHAPGAPLCHRFIFSDSIILVSLDDGPLSALKLLIYAWRVTQTFIAFKMPLRGGVAYGELHSNPGQNICLGKALTRAYELEQSQAWIGTAIDPSVEKAFPELFQENGAHRGCVDEIFLRYDVPFKGSPSQQLRTLNWRFNLIVEEGTRSLFVQDGPPDVMEKVANALEYAKFVIDSGHIYVADQSALPVEIRSMWVGGTEPPFPHGDDL